MENTISIALMIAGIKSVCMGEWEEEQTTNYTVLRAHQSMYGKDDP